MGSNTVALVISSVGIAALLIFGVCAILLNKRGPKNNSPEKSQSSTTVSEETHTTNFTEVRNNLTTKEQEKTHITDFIEPQNESSDDKNFVLNSDEENIGTHKQLGNKKDIRIDTGHPLLDGIAQFVVNIATNFHEQEKEIKKLHDDAGKLSVPTIAIDNGRFIKISAQGTIMLSQDGSASIEIKPATVAEIEELYNSGRDGVFAVVSKNDIKRALRETVSKSLDSEQIYRVFPFLGYGIF